MNDNRQTMTAHDEAEAAEADRGRKLQVDEKERVIYRVSRQIRLYSLQC